MSGGLALAGVSPASPRQAGLAMLELLVALLIFSIGMLGLLSGQLAGKRVGYDALQRSVATGLARDILERVQANPGHVQAYRLGAVSGADQPLPDPSVDCDSTACTGAELAAFDLWQWQSRLLGGTGERAGTGGLLSPRACITGEGSVVEVVISWLGLTPAGPRQPLPCAVEEDAGSAMRALHRLRMVVQVAGLP